MYGSCLSISTCNHVSANSRLGLVVIETHAHARTHPRALNHRDQLRATSLTMSDSSTSGGLIKAFLAIELDFARLGGVRITSSGSQTQHFQLLASRARTHGSPSGPVLPHCSRSALSLPTNKFDQYKTPPLRRSSPILSTLRACGNPPVVISAAQSLRAS